VIARAGPPSVHAVALAAVAALMLAAAAALPLDAPPLSLLGCPFRAAAGLPCPGCGCTRAFHFAVRGQLGMAVAHNPLGTLLALTAAVHVLWTALRVAGLRHAPRIEATPRARLIAALALAANWIFLALRDSP
jgi:hypothetical protein